MKYDAVVVGAGLFGQVIAANLRRLGMQVVVVDDREPHAGSKPAACLMKPSWFSSLGREVYEPSLQLLDELYGVRDITFKVGPTSTSVHWCDPQKILSGPSSTGHALRVEPGLVRFRDCDIECTTAIVAAGVWTRDLVDVPGLVGRAGAAFLWPEQSIEEPFIRPWAPYRQLVAFNRGDGLWVGDGTAIKPENWSEEREMLSRSRCWTAIGKGRQSHPHHTLYGIRPYVPKAKPCHLVMEPGLVVATGGAKNGTLAAGWCAHKIGEALS